MIDSWTGANLVGMYSNYTHAILTFFFLLFFHVICWNIEYNNYFFYISFHFIFHYFKFIFILIKNKQIQI